GGAQWFVENTGAPSGGQPTAGSCGENLPGLTVKDASFQGQSDAFDNGIMLWINGAVFVSPRTVDVTGTTLTAGPQTMSGANITVQYFATSGATLRTLASFENAGASALTLTVNWVTNFGSNANTIIPRTSTGGTAPTTADRWIVSADGGSAGNPPKALAST